METTVNISYGEAFMSAMSKKPKTIHRHATDVWEYDTDTDFDLARLVSEAQPGQLPYMAFSESQLLRLITSRKLAHKLHRYTKAALVFALDDADANPIFHKWSELAPELRLCIYEHHLRESTEGEVITGPHKQPPITHVNRLTRKESLPVFYTTCTIGMRWQGTLMLDEATEMTPHPRSVALRGIIPPGRFNTIRNFQFEVSMLKEFAYDEEDVKVLHYLVNTTSKADGNVSKVQVRDLVYPDTVVDVSENRDASPEKVKKWFEQMLAEMLARPPMVRWKSSDFAGLAGHFTYVAKHVNRKQRL